MIYLRSLPLLLTMLLFGSCADYFPGVGILAPADLTGYQMDASGFKGSYNCLFQEDGSYILTTTNLANHNNPPEKGTWKWQRKSARDAILTLDDKMVINLHFTTRDHANATIPDSDDLFAIDFVAPDES